MCMCEHYRCLVSKIIKQKIRMGCLNRGDRYLGWGGGGVVLVQQPPKVGEREEEKDKTQ